MLIEITYDRKQKEYQWVDPNSGEILTAPPKCKGDLFRAAVGLLDPSLYEAVITLSEKHPQLERIAWKAAEIVVSNGVEILGDENLAVLARVASSDGMGRYAVEYSNSCNCEHFVSQAAPMTSAGHCYCKHILAAHLYLRTRESRF